MHASLSTPGAARRGIFACQRECRTAARCRDVLHDERKKEKREKRKAGKEGKKSRLGRKNLWKKQFFARNFFYGSRDL